MIEGDDGFRGIADIFPLRFLGDPEVDSVLQNHEHSLFRNAIEFADRERLFQKNEVPFFSKSFVESNVLMTDFDELLSPSTLERVPFMKTIKLKGTKDFISIAAALNSFCKQLEDDDILKLRIDFNSVLTHEQLVTFLDHLSECALEKIEYLEDPMPWNQEQWEALTQRIPLAADESLEQVVESKAKIPFLVVKPARLGVHKTKSVVEKSMDQKIIFTSSMDHLVGILHSISLMQELESQFPEKVHPVGGFLTLDAYHEFPFADWIDTTFSKLSLEKVMGTSSTGLHADLLKLAWRSLGD